VKRHASQGNSAAQRFKMTNGMGDIGVPCSYIAAIEARQERTMLGKNAVDEELRRGVGLSIDQIEPLLRAGGDAAEMKFMECCRHLWTADGVELMEPFIETAFNNLPEKSRCILFQRMLTIVYLAQAGERPPP
jgi:hypothetical protein